MAPNDRPASLKRDLDFLADEPSIRTMAARANRLRAMAHIGQAGPLWALEIAGKTGSSRGASSANLGLG